MPIPSDYAECVYAGVLGKIIGVYLGRPFEGWNYDKILAELGEVWYYVHEKRGVPLVVTDDDISGTFTFLRALPDYGNTPDLTPQQIGQTWLNYIIEKRAILWWGGMGNSTEHTAFLRLKAGISAPRSGSIALNGQVVAEQIGAQIFIDGWGLVCPGEPERAADFARRAASVSHDGEAIYGAQVVAAMEAQAFVEQNINKLIDTAVQFIPHDSLIYHLIHDLREWHSREPDWRKTREQIVARYGYDKYGGGCHMIPNHALIIHALLHGEGDFQKSLMIVNTCGWDTDCNSANVGCLLGIRGGLAAIDDGPDWRGPIADRLYLPTADGGRSITDAVQETYRIVNIGRALQGETPLAPKNGARFHFSLPGSVQGFHLEDSPECHGIGYIHNVQNQLAVSYHHLAPGRAMRVTAATFIPPEAANMPGYGLIACPTLYSGQTVRTRVVRLAAMTTHVQDAKRVLTVPVNEAVCRLYLRCYDAQDKLISLFGPPLVIGAETSGTPHDLEWRLPDTQGCPIAEIGVELTSATSESGMLCLHFLTWDGAPDIKLERPKGKMARRQWVDGVDHFEEGGEPLRLIQDTGTGLLIHGTRDWTDYQVTAVVTPHMVKSCGIAARVQGMKRYYALLLGSDNTVRLVKALDGDHTLAEFHFPLDMDMKYELSLRVHGDHLQAELDGNILFDLRDTDAPLLDGAIALICEEGRMAAEWVRVQP
jgi:ADP-ribosylglycohydrolase